MSASLNKKRLKFKFDDEVILLREIVSRNPFKNGNTCWEEVKSSFLLLTQKDFTVKSIRQHVQMLIANWKNKDVKTQKRLVILSKLNTTGSKLFSILLSAPIILCKSSISISS